MSSSVYTPARNKKIDKEILHRKKPYFAAKRIIDFSVSLVALVVLLPVFSVISLIIVIDDPGAGPIFRQQRCGKDGKTFFIYKFRTMVSDAEQRLDEVLALNESDGPVFKIKDDPRITKAGKFLRRTSIDELPQLINIIKGDMSIVGPRPPLPREVEQYNDFQRQRLLITGGLTCYWQIMPARNDIPFDEWVNLDIKYIESCGILTDIKIIFKTVSAVFNGEGR